MVFLETPLQQFATVNKSLLRRLHHLGLKTAADLLFYFPSRYDDFRQVALVSQIRPGEKVTVRGRLQLIANKRSFYRRRILTEAMVADESGQLKIIWFNQPYLIKILKVGDRLSLAGKVEADNFGWQMVNPVFEKEKPGAGGVHTGRLVPIYPATAGLTQKHLRFLIKTALPAAGRLKDWLPPELTRANQFLPLTASIRQIHFPADEKRFQKASRRFKFEELFLIQLRNESLRRELKQNRAPAIFFKEKETKNFVVSLPFKLTMDQRRAAWEILQDLARGEPMNRLLNGEVGSGKTVVAAIAAYNAILNDYQAVLLAPTEILASQHFETMTKLFEGLRIGLLTGGQVKTSKRQRTRACPEPCPERSRRVAEGNKEQIDKSSAPCSLFFVPSKKDFLAMVKEGDIDLAIGTHALLEDRVQFKNLGLAVVDEQHRFGVEQRRRLREKSGDPAVFPHFLSMTATPIPRSFALSLYGDLDLSLIKEMPKDRKKTITRLVEPVNRQKAYDFIREQVRQGGQVFVVCPAIEEKSAASSRFAAAERKNVLAERKKLSEEIFPDLKIGSLHGRMKPKEKEAIMKDFLDKKIDILVSTSVVEVGVDIPNASVMMIEGAERFGLAQLHQFRGRVGRGERQSFCLLFTDSANEAVKKRLGYFVSSRDGFELAEKDLETRGPGEIFGTVQHGFPELKIADLREIELIKKAREAAKLILDKSPDLGLYPLASERLARWEKEVHLE